MKKFNGGKGKMHINLLLTKYAVLEEAMSFGDYETMIESTGECIKKNNLIELHLLTPIRLSNSYVIGLTK